MMQDHIFTKADLGRLLLPCPECGSDLGHVPMCSKASPRKPGDPCDCAATHAELTRLRAEVQAARAEGARQERERIRGLPLTDPIRTAVWGFESELNLEFQDGYDPSVTWRALLAAITEGE